jgi:hypothetical protein
MIGCAAGVIFQLPPKFRKKISIASIGMADRALEASHHHMGVDQAKLRVLESVGQGAHDLEAARPP